MILLRLIAVALLLASIYEGNRLAEVILLAWIVGTMELHGLAWRRTLQGILAAERWRARDALAQQLANQPDQDT